MVAETRTKVIFWGIGEQIMENRHSVKYMGLSDEDKH
jgi:hypothetical protein